MDYKKAALAYNEHALKLKGPNAVLNIVKEGRTFHPPGFEPSEDSPQKRIKKRHSNNNNDSSEEEEEDDNVYSDENSDNEYEKKTNADNNNNNNSLKPSASKLKGKGSSLNQFLPINIPFENLLMDPNLITIPSSFSSFTTTANKLLNNLKE